ncbi:MAG: hypothetical protein ILP08_04550 [Lachnospiraceae bacterium]|nr:hypothetical protein [Lachnospiraceae bacterium]
MLNEERVRVMTRLAIEEKTGSPVYRRAENLGRRDYVSFHGVVAFIVGTIIFVFLFALLLLTLFFTSVYSLTDELLKILLLILVLGYIGFVLVFVISVRRSAKKDFQEDEKKLQRMSAGYDRLHELYKAEEDNTRTLKTLTKNKKGQHKAGSQKKR